MQYHFTLLVGSLNANPRNDIVGKSVRKVDDLDSLEYVAQSSFTYEVNQTFILQLERVLGKESIKVNSVLSGGQQHSCENIRKESNVVLLPQNVQQVSAVVKMCNKENIPLVTFSSDVGLQNDISISQEGIIMDLTSMDKIVEVNTNDFDCTVEPGVTHEALNQYLSNAGLWFPVDPDANLSICGMAATGASGTSAICYGAMVHNVLNLEVVLPNGDILHTSGKGRRPKKSTAGYNLTKLFVGSQGTLGVITQAVVKLHARPAVCSVAVCPFLTVNKAVEAAVGTLQCSVPIAKLEFLDANAIAACNKYSKLTLTESPSLFMEFHGSSEAEVAAQASLVEIFASNDGTQFTWLHALEEQKKLWIARHSVHNSILSLKDNVKASKCLTTDVSVPISALSQIITETRQEIDHSGIFGAVVGHVGFGHFRCILLADDSDENQKRVIMELFDHTYRRALAVGGSCAGEFGIGIDQRKYLKTERGEVGVNTMIAIKKALDPNGIMNSKKLFMEI